VHFDIPIFSKLYTFYQTLSDTLLIFPKRKRYTIGQRLDQLALDIFELVISAGHATREHKMPILQQTSAKLDLLKILVRLSNDTKCLDNKRYQELSTQLVEIGRMLGGWIKSLST